jgi:hypothetical protein
VCVFVGGFKKGGSEHEKQMCCVVYRLHLPFFKKENCSLFAMNDYKKEKNASAKRGDFFEP